MVNGEWITKGNCHKDRLVKWRMDSKKERWYSHSQLTIDKKRKGSL